MTHTIHFFQKKKILLYLKDMRRRMPLQALSETIPGRGPRSATAAGETVDGAWGPGDNDFYF
ncbi:hypothetical protein [uncultured Massilia sp.]|uniref:hypothetical protein n=1 Tax=uncultured Massilia sp. TaxID=169973 RepID=UPI0025884386|nr:hypothetical protein [uncultured Massilia sp.]